MEADERVQRQSIFGMVIHRKEDITERAPVLPHNQPLLPDRAVLSGNERHEV